MTVGDGRNGGFRRFFTSGFLLNVGVAIIAASMVLLLWWAVFEPVSPLRSALVVAIEPSARVVDRDRGEAMVITRRVCMRRGAWGTVDRYWVDGIEYKAPPSPPTWFSSGCHNRERRLEIPATLPPGRYVYRASITFCNRIRCETAWVQDVPLVIRGGYPPEAQGPVAPIDPPL